MYCRKCGTLIIEGSSFCTECGTAVVIRPPAEPPLPSAGAAAVPAAETPEPVAPTPVEDETSSVVPEPANPHLKINVPAPENAEATAGDKPEPEPVGEAQTDAPANDGPETASAPEPEEEPAADAAPKPGAIPEGTTITVEVPVIIVTEPRRPEPAPNTPSMPDYFSAAGNLDGSPMAAAPRPSAPPASSSPKLSGTARPAVAAPRPTAGAPAVIDTGGYVEPTGARPVVHYTENPYVFGDTEEELEEAESRRNLVLWIVVGVLALGVIAAACAIFFVPAVHDAVFGAPAIELRDDTLQLTVGEKRDLNDTLELEHVDENKIGWKSSDPAVVTVRDGKLEAVAPGACEITVYSKQDEDLADTIQVTVTEPVVPEGGV